MKNAVELYLSNARKDKMHIYKEILLDTFSVVKDTVLDEYLPGDVLKILTTCRIIKSLIGLMAVP